MVVCYLDIYKLKLKQCTHVVQSFCTSYILTNAVWKSGTAMIDVMWYDRGILSNYVIIEN